LDSSVTGVQTCALPISLIDCLHEAGAIIAKAAGVPRTEIVNDCTSFVEAVNKGLAAKDLTTIVAKVEASGPTKYVTDLNLLENRFEFSRYLRSLKRPQP